MTWDIARSTGDWWQVTYRPRENAVLQNLALLAGDDKPRNKHQSTLQQWRRTNSALRILNLLVPDHAHPNISCQLTYVTRQILTS